MSSSISKYNEVFSRPFGEDEIKFKVQKKFENEAMALIVAYIDARAVMDRLDESGAEWSDSYVVHQGGVECKLTIEGVTRTDVGENAEAGSIDQSMKSGYSDAFKRAAVKFGIGRHLYSLPRLKARVTQMGRTWVIDRNELPRLYSEIRGGVELPTINPKALLVSKLEDEKMDYTNEQVATIMQLCSVDKDSSEIVWKSWCNYVVSALKSGKTSVESTDFANGKYQSYMERI